MRNSATQMDRWRARHTDEPKNGKLFAPHFDFVVAVVLAGWCESKEADVCKLREKSEGKRKMGQNNETKFREKNTTFGGRMEFVCLRNAITVTHQQLYVEFSLPFLPHTFLQ